LKNAFRFLLWCAAIGWTALMYVLSMQDGSVSSALSEGVSVFLMKVLEFIRVDFDTFHIWVRKMAHFLGFAAEGFFLWSALRSVSRPSLTWVLALGAGIALSVGNEYVQTLTVGRSCELRDMAINFAGYAAGAWCIALAAELFHHPKRKQEN